MAGYQVNASDVAGLIDLVNVIENKADHHEQNPVSIVYSFKKLLANSAHFSTFKDYEKNTRSSFHVDTVSYLARHGIQSNWEEEMLKASMCKTLEDVDDVKKRALCILLQNQTMIDTTTRLVDKINSPAVQIVASQRLQLVMTVASHTRVTTDIEQLKSQIETLNDTEAYPMALFGQFLALHADLKLACGMYFKIAGNAAKSYGVASEESSVALYNRVHDVKLVRNRLLVEKVLKLPCGAPDVLLRGIIDAHLGDEIVEVKHRTGPYRDELSIADKTQVHVYMFVQDKHKCLLLETVNLGGMVFTKERDVYFDEPFWTLVKHRFSTLINFTEHLVKDSLFMHLFFTVSLVEQARFIRYVFEQVNSPVQPSTSETKHRKKRHKAANTTTSTKKLHKN
jgi:hypothetical protein